MKNTETSPPAELNSASKQPMPLADSSALNLRQLKLQVSVLTTALGANISTEQHENLLPDTHNKLLTFVAISQQEFRTADNQTGLKRHGVSV